MFILALVLFSIQKMMKKFHVLIKRFLFRGFLFELLLHNFFRLYELVYFYGRNLRKLCMQKLSKKRI